MPYIKEEERAIVDKIIEDLTTTIDRYCIGNVNPAFYAEYVCKLLTYSVYKIMVYYYKGRPWYKQADVIKICEAVKTEFIRRHLSEYEDKKLQENGDI